MKRTFRLSLLIGIAFLALIASRLGWFEIRGSSRDQVRPHPQSPSGDHKVILVMVDGLRLQESYRANDFHSDLRPTRNYTQRLTSELLPLGTVYPDARTGAFNTITTACTNTIVTGAWNPGPNRGRGAESSDDDFVDNRSYDRTIFELARAQLGLPRPKVAFVSNKLNTRLSDHSYHPLGGEELGPAKHIFRTRFNEDEAYKEETWIDPVNNSDRQVFDTALEILDRDEPRLLFLSFGNIDIAGHRSTKDDQADYRFYTRSIEIWDNLIANLWHEIQQRPAYSGNTTMILCSDHGRHGDHDSNAYGSHQGTCEETRNIVCFVMGPHTPPGLVVDRRVYQTAFMPTIAALLGVRTPEATGQPLYEAIGQVPEIDGPRYRRNMRAAIDGAAIAVAYRRADGSGNDRIEVQTATGDGPFAPPTVVARSTWDSGEFHDLPDVVIDRGTIHVAAWHWTDDNHEVLHWSSDDGAGSFSAPSVLATGKTENSRFGEISLRGFALHASGGRSHLILPAIAQPGAGAESVLTQIESVRFGVQARKTRRDRIDRPRRIGHHRWLDLAVGDGGEMYTAFAALHLPSDRSLRPMRSAWEIFVKRLDGTQVDEPALRITDNNTVPDIMPAIAVGADRHLSVVFCRPDPDAVFQLYLAQGDLDDGIDTPHRLTNSRIGAWQPDALELDDDLHVAYIDFDSGDGDVHYALVREGRIVGPPINLSASRTGSRNPHILHDVDNARLHVVWEEEDASEGFRILKRSIPLNR